MEPALTGPFTNTLGPLMDKPPVTVIGPITTSEESAITPAFPATCTGALSDTELDVNINVPEVTD